MTAVAHVRTRPTAMLKAACRSGKIANLAVADGPHWRMHRARLFSFDPIEGQLRIARPKPAYGAGAVTVTPGLQIAVRVLSASRRIMFMASVTGVCNFYLDGERHEAVELHVRSNLVSANRREHFRVDVPEDRPLEMVVWDISMANRVDDEADPPVFRARLGDLSIGGTSIYDVNGDTDWKLGDHLGVKLHAPGAEPLLLIAEIRRVSVRPDARPCYGLAFIGAETVRKTFYAQEVLSRLVNGYQRRRLKKRVRIVDRAPN